MSEPVVDHVALGRVVHWLVREIVVDARGDGQDQLDRDPASLFWLGRLAPECDVLESANGDRAERLEPCAIGIRIRPSRPLPASLLATVRFHIWSKRTSQRVWTKSVALEIPVTVALESVGTFRFGEDRLREAIKNATGRTDLSAAVEAIVERRVNGVELTIQLVNSSETRRGSSDDRHLYECTLTISGIEWTSFALEALPDSFRYDRSLPAIGFNCAVQAGQEILTSSDVPAISRWRPVFVPAGLDEADLSFSALANDPVPCVKRLVQAHGVWGEANWNEVVLERRAQTEHWSSEMTSAAAKSATDFWKEHRRLCEGVTLLESDASLCRAFKLMNRAMETSAAGKFPGWRAFQVGFLLANLSSVSNSAEAADTVDIVWFATGGGKTETYLGLLVIAMLLDRMREKLSGITAWSRFPLRMLSLQQTQRFADAVASAELVRRQEGIPGDPFSLGFFVGQGATPNAISSEPAEGQPDPYDDEMPRQFLVLSACPFCRRESLEMRFDHTSWRLQHVCTAKDCSWPENALPFFVVDEEIYRFLPTVVVGTLDKAASISMQAAMRGFVGPPLGKCPHPEHGYTYSPRSSKPTGCLVPGCSRTPQSLAGKAEDFAPSFRLQDELHLLRDSLGAVDAHYESLYDHLSLALSGRRPKILASSATLAGYERQVDVLYGRSARVFPEPGPSPGVGFWSSESDALMRHYVAFAPRGVTLEHAVDRVLTCLQRSIRRLVADATVCEREIGIPNEMAPIVASLYGTDVVYGNTLRDLDAIGRSAESQLQVDGEIRQRALTGRTDFSDVRKVLRELEEPPADYFDRVHIVTASSMMSHGVDIDRLNVMTMVGLPLGTAEFIQATARVGRRYPGLVLVIPKMARERDAGIYRAFDKFVEHGDRFVEPIPITRRSRRVLQRTLAGLELARILMVHEPRAGKALTTLRRMAEYLRSGQFDPEEESLLLSQSLRLDDSLDESLRNDLRAWMDKFVSNISDPPPDARFLGHAAPGQGPMRSLRDVEEPVTIYGLADQ